MSGQPLSHANRAESYLNGAAHAAKHCRPLTISETAAERTGASTLRLTRAGWNALLRSPALEAVELLNAKAMAAATLG